jgi:S-adenosylmethionine:diacylglycerol 3-amino-3-carboxypropyl transferase
VPGYRTYNLAKAKSLVKQLGGMNIQLGTINLPLANETDEALQSQWKRVPATGRRRRRVPGRELDGRGVQAVNGT